MGHVDHPPVKLRQAFQFGARDRIVSILESPEPDRLLIDEPADRAIILNALPSVRSFPRVFEQPVELGVGIIGESERASAAAISVHLYTRIADIYAPP